MIADGYLVTNAHVVAGAREIARHGRGQTADATVVLFDPELDVALLHAPGIRAAALQFATSDPARGTTAPSSAIPAAAR